MQDIIKQWGNYLLAYKFPFCETYTLITSLYGPVQISIMNGQFRGFTGHSYSQVITYTEIKVKKHQNAVQNFDRFYWNLNENVLILILLT